MPFSASPTMLLAAASIALLAGRYFQFRAKRICEFSFLIAILSAAYFLSIEPVRTDDAPGLSHIRPVFRNDALACCEQWLILVFGLLTGLSFFDAPRRDEDTPNTYGFLLFAIAGLMLVAGSNDFLSLGLSLEIVNLAVLALRRLSSIPLDDRSSNGSQASAIDNARTKDLWFGGIATGGMWLGIALLSNAVATTHFDAARQVLTAAYDPGNDQAAIGTPSKLILLAVGLIAMSQFARMGLVPFSLGFGSNRHDSSRPVNGIGMLAGQLAGSIALTRLFGCVLVGLGQSLAVLTMTVTLATFVVAAIMALRGLAAGVRSISRWVKSLVLLQSGWLAVGLITASIERQHLGIRWGEFTHENETLGLIVFTQLTSLLGCGGVFWALGHLKRVDRDVEFLEDVKGLREYAPTVSLALIVALATLVGCPFTLGFWARWTILLAGSNVHLKSTSRIFEPHSGLRFVMLTGIVATTLTSIAVFRMAREMFFESPLARPVPIGGRGSLLASVIAAVACVLFGIAPQLALSPLKAIRAPRPFAPVAPQRGSGKNSLGLRDLPLKNIDRTLPIQNPSRNLCHGVASSSRRCSPTSCDSRHSLDLEYFRKS